MISWPIKKLGEEKEPVQPSLEESEFAKTIDGQIMVMLKKAIMNKYFIEAQALSWTTIEQLLLPRLIGWIAKELKITLPEGVFKSNAQNINYIYLTISHDEELYKKLEESRKKRNRVVHKLTSLGNIKSINKLAIDCTETNLLLQQEIMKRFDGKVLIPSINLYKDGWNDALSSLKKFLKEAREEIERI